MVNKKSLFQECKDGLVFWSPWMQIRTFNYLKKKKKIHVGEKNLTWFSIYIWLIESFLQQAFFFFFSLLLLRPRHTEVPRPEVKSELQLQAYATAGATPDLSHICHLYRNLWQHQTPKLLSEARDQNCILTETTLGP